MTTLIFTSKSKAARQMIEYLKTQPYVKIIEEDKPNSITMKAVEESRSRKGKTVKSITYKDVQEGIRDMKAGKVKPISNLFK